MDATARKARARIAAKKARRYGRRVLKKAQGRALVNPTIVKRLGKIQDDLENNLPPLQYLPEVDLRKYAVTNPFDWRPVTRLRRHKHPKKYPIPVLDRLVQRHYKATRETQLGIDGEYKALMYMLIATLISPPYNKAVMIIDLAHEFDASEVLKHAPYTWTKIPMLQRPVPIRNKIQPRPRSNKRKAVRQMQRRGSGKKSKSNGIPSNELSTVKPIAEQAGAITISTMRDPTARPVHQAAGPSAGTAATIQDQAVEKAMAKKEDDSGVKFEWVKPDSQRNTWDFSRAENVRLQKQSKSRGKGVTKPSSVEQQGRSRTSASSGAVQSSSAQHEDEFLRQARSDMVAPRSRQEMTGDQHHTSGESRILAQAWSREPIQLKRPMTQLQALRSVPRPQSSQVQPGAGREGQAQRASEAPASGQRKTDNMPANQPEATPAAGFQSVKAPSSKQTGIFARKIQRPIARAPKPPAWNHGYYLQMPRQRIQRRTVARAGSKRKRSATSAPDVTVVPLAKRPALPKRLAESMRYRQQSVPVQSVHQVLPTLAPNSRAQLTAERKAAMLLERRAAVYAAQVKWAEKHETLLGEKQYPRWMPSASRLRGRDDIFDLKYPDNINKRWLRLAEGRFKMVGDTVAVPKHPPFHHPWMPRPETTGFWPAAKPRPREDPTKIDPGSSSDTNAKPTAQSSGRPALTPEILAKIDASQCAAEARWAANPDKEEYAAGVRGSSSTSASELGDTAGRDASQRQPAVTHGNPAAAHTVSSDQQPPQPDMAMPLTPPAAQRAVNPKHSPNTKTRIEASRRAAEEKNYASGEKLATSSRASPVPVESTPKKINNSEGMFALGTTARAQHSPQTQAKVMVNPFTAKQRYDASGSRVISQPKALIAEANPTTTRHPSSIVKPRPSPEVLAMIEAKKLAAHQRFEARGNHIVAQAWAEVAMEGSARPSVAVAQEYSAPYVTFEHDVHGGEGDEEVYAEFEDSGEHLCDFDTMEGVVLGSQDNYERSQTIDLDKMEEAYDDETELITGSQARRAIERRLAAREDKDQSKSEIERRDDDDDDDDEEDILTGTQAKLATEQRVAAAREQERTQTVMRRQPLPDDALPQSTATKGELAVETAAAHQRRAVSPAQALPAPPRLVSGLPTQHASHVQRSVRIKQPTIPPKQDGTPNSGSGLPLGSPMQQGRPSDQSGAKRKRGDTKSFPQDGGAAEFTVQHHGSEDMGVSFYAGQVFEEPLVSSRVKPEAARKGIQTKKAPRLTLHYLGSEDVQVDHLGMIIEPDLATTEAPSSAGAQSVPPKQPFRAPVRHLGSEDMEVDTTGMPIDKIAAIQEQSHDNSRILQQRRAVRPAPQSYGSEDMQVDMTGQVMEQELASVQTTQSRPPRPVRRVWSAESDDVHVFDAQAAVASHKHTTAQQVVQAQLAPIAAPSRRTSDTVQLDLGDLVARRSVASSRDSTAPPQQSTPQQPSARQRNGQQAKPETGKANQVSPLKSRSSNKTASGSQQPSDVEATIKANRLAARPRRAKNIAVRSLEVVKDHAQKLEDQSNQQRSAAVQARLANHLLVAEARLARAKQVDHPGANMTPFDECQLPADLQEKIITFRVAAQRILAVDMGMEDPSVLSHIAARLKAIPQRLHDDPARSAATSQKSAAIQEGKGKMAAQAKHDLPAEVQAKITALQRPARKKVVTMGKRQSVQPINRRTADEQDERDLHIWRAQEKLAEAKLALLPADHAKLMASLRTARRKILAKRKAMARIVAAAKHIARFPQNVRVKYAAPLRALTQKLEAEQDKTSRASLIRQTSVHLRHGRPSEHQQSSGLVNDQSRIDGRSAAIDPETAGFLRACRDLGIYANLDIAKEALAQAPGGDENKAMNWLLDKQARGELPNEPRPGVEHVDDPGPSKRQSDRLSRHEVREAVAEARRRRAKRRAVRAQRTRRLLARPYVRTRLEAIRSNMAASAQEKSAARARYGGHVRILHTSELVDEHGRAFQTMFGSEDIDCVLPGMACKTELASAGEQSHPQELRRKLEAVKHIVFERLVARLAMEPQARLVQARRQLRQVIAHEKAPATKQHGTEHKPSLLHQAAMDRLASVEARGDEARATRFGRVAAPCKKSKLSDVWTHEYGSADKEIGVIKRSDNSCEEQRARKQKEIVYLRSKHQKVDAEPEVTSETTNTTTASMPKQDSVLQANATTRTEHDMRKLIQHPATDDHASSALPSAFGSTAGAKDLKRFNCHAEPSTDEKPISRPRKVEKPAQSGHHPKIDTFVPLVSSRRPVVPAGPSISKTPSPRPEARVGTRSMSQSRKTGNDKATHGASESEDRLEPNRRAATVKSTRRAASVVPRLRPLADPSTSNLGHVRATKSNAEDQLNATGTTNTADQSKPAQISKTETEDGPSKSGKTTSYPGATADFRPIAPSMPSAKSTPSRGHMTPGTVKSATSGASGQPTVKPTRHVAHPRREKTRASRPGIATAQPASVFGTGPALPVKTPYEVKHNVQAKPAVRPTQASAQTWPPVAAAYSPRYRRPPLPPIKPKQVDRADLKHVYVCRPRFHPQNSYFWEAEGYLQTKHVVDTARAFIREGRHLQNSAGREMWGTIIIGHKRSLADEADFEADVVCGTVKGWLTVKPEVVRPFQPGRSLREYLAARAMRFRDKENASNFYATSPWAQMVFNRQGMADLNWDRAWQTKKWKSAPRRVAK